jgi:hypothetical protein
MSETPELNERRHAEAPAEGEDTDADETPSEERVHAEEPAEGEDGKGIPDDGPPQALP